MCGIFGIYSPERSASLPQAIEAANRLAHRGPDDQGAWCSPDRQACLAHRRLSLVSIDNGTQPIFSENRDIVGVVNGEFYGHQGIRKQLELQGHRFQRDCDSEIAIHLYQRHGLSFVDHLNGNFAILLWDQKQSRMIAVRDRFGIKPLAYAIDNQRNIMYASEAKAILPLLQNRDWDPQSLNWATSLQYLPQDRTLFAGIKMVPPGHMAIASESGFRLQKYWDLDYPDAETATRDLDKNESADAVQQTRQLLKRAVLQRMEADAPVCFHLSGGLDSSSALGIASRESGQRQQAFSISFDSAPYDESEIAIETAKFCNADLELVRLTEQDLIENIIPASFASEGLAINGHLPAKYLLNKAIRERGFSAAITGEGADETFLGYAHLKMDWWSSVAVSFQQTNLNESNRSSIGMMLPHGKSLPLDLIEKQLNRVPAFLAAKATLGYRVHSLFSDDWLATRAGLEDGDAYGQLIESATKSGQLQGRTAIHQSAWLWTKLALAGYILKTLGDGTEMAWSIEGRLPFLDHKLFEFVRSQSVHQLIKGRTEKHLLREAVKSYVPRQVYLREKHPFDAPPLLTSSSQLVRQYLYDQINSDLFRAQPLFCHNKVTQLLDRVPDMDRLERQVWDPVVMMICSLLGNQKLISHSKTKVMA